MTVRERHLLSLCASVCLMLGDEALSRVARDLANAADEPAERIEFLRQSERLLGGCLTMLRRLIAEGDEGDEK